MSRADEEVPAWLASTFGGRRTRHTPAEAVDGLSPRAKRFVGDLIAKSEQHGREAQFFRNPPCAGFAGDFVVLVGGLTRLIAVQLDEDTEVVVVFGEDEAITNEIGGWTEQADRFAEALKYVDSLLA